MIADDLSELIEWTTQAEAEAILAESLRRKQIGDYVHHANDRRDQLRRWRTYAIRSALVAAMVAFGCIGMIAALAALLVR